MKRFWNCQFLFQSYLVLVTAALSSRYIIQVNPCNSNACTVKFTAPTVRNTGTGEIRVQLQIPYVYVHMTKLANQQTEVVQFHENENFRNIRQGEARHRKYRRLKQGGGQYFYWATVSKAKYERVYMLYSKRPGLTERIYAKVYVFLYCIIIIIIIIIYHFCAEYVQIKRPTLKKTCFQYT